MILGRVVGLFDGGGTVGLAVVGDDEGGTGVGLALGYGTKNKRQTSILRNMQFRESMFMDARDHTHPCGNNIT